MTDKLPSVAETIKNLERIAGQVANPPDQFEQDIAAAISHLERMEAIVNALPKTKDGVPIVPGMDVWWIAIHGTKSGQVLNMTFSDLGVDGTTPIAQFSHGWDYDICVGRGHDAEVFSTEAAALAAKEGGAK